VNVYKDFKTGRTVSAKTKDEAVKLLGVSQRYGHSYVGIEYVNSRCVEDVV